MRCVDRSLLGALSGLRAKLLYALYPADGNFFSTVNGDPLCLFLYALRLVPLYGISILVFLLTFFLIDRTDEFQLVNYILKFKAFQFITYGLCAGIALGLAAAQCVLGEYGGAASLCFTDALPGQSFAYHLTIALEPLRIALVYAAFLLLYLGQAYGGRPEILALEDRRLDAADNTIDGKVDRDILRRARSFNAQRCPSQRADLDEQLTKHREQHNVQTQHGHLLCYAMLYDLLVLVLVLNGITLYIPWKHGYLLDGESEMWWATLYFAECVYALAAFPFFLFSFPIVGPLLHGAQRTAYDQSGMLCPALSSSLIKAKIKAQAEDPTEAKLIGRLGGYVQVYGNMAASIIQQRSRERAQKAKEEEAETERDLREMLVGLDPTVEGEDGTKASAPAAAALPAKPSTRADKDLEAGGGLSA